jgi:beta-glucosidase
MDNSDTAKTAGTSLPSAAKPSEATVHAAEERLDETPYAVAKARVRAGADPDAEARALVGRMTIEEKLGCLDGDIPFWPGIIDMAGGGYYRHTFPAARVDRLGFPGFDFTDGPRGVVVGHSTCFPVTMARGATFDVALEEKIGEAIGIEARIQGASFYGGVCVNLLRHPRWGRAQETYGEDPHHLGEMGSALVRGVQKHAMACVKHFACNSIETARFKVNVLADRQALDRVYLAHFRRIVDEGVASVMTSYNALNGRWCGDNEDLLTHFLRDEWGFDGFTVSDFLYGLRDPAGSLAAGMDVEMPFRQQRAAALPGAVGDGSLAIEHVDRAATRVVRTVLRFDAATADEPPDPALLCGPAHRRLAREAAAASFVLLRNEPHGGESLLEPHGGESLLEPHGGESVSAPHGGEPVLPIRPGSVRRIAVVGRLASVANLGDRGSSNVHPPSVATPLDGLRAAYPDVEWTDDAATADVAVVVVGYTFEDEGEFTGGFTAELHALMPAPPDEDMWRRLADAPNSGEGMALGGDRPSLRLRADDEATILAVCAVQPRTVVLLMGGSAVLVEPWIDSTAAVMQVWYPGMEGGHAIADVLTGAADPGGRLPFAVPTDESHLAFFDPDANEIRYDLWHGQWLLDRDGHRARYPFGFGLSYTRFALANAAAAAGRISVEVANTGAREGTTVVYFFVSDPPAWRLFAFRKVRLTRGATEMVHVEATATGRVMIASHARDPEALYVDVVANEQARASGQSRRP